LVDDDPDVQAFLADSLESLGYEAVVVEDGTTALRTLRKLAPQATILNFAMPGMNGAKVAKEPEPFCLICRSSSPAAMRKAHRSSVGAD
jgi:CheY-like chemotaxis protein